MWQGCIWGVAVEYRCCGLKILWDCEKLTRIPIHTNDAHFLSLPNSKLSSFLNHKMRIMKLNKLSPYIF